MAEVLRYWPPVRPMPEAKMVYPWTEWANGDIWLADKGVDFPADSHAVHFRAILYTQAQRLTKSRMVAAKRKLAGKVVRPGTVVVTPVRVKVRMVSATQVAFQFYDGDEPPPEPEVIHSAVPVRGRQGNRHPLKSRRASSRS